MLNAGVAFLSRRLYRKRSRPYKRHGGRTCAGRWRCASRLPGAAGGRCAPGRERLPSERLRTRSRQNRRNEGDGVQRGPLSLTWPRILAYSIRSVTLAAWMPQERLTASHPAGGPGHAADWISGPSIIMLTSLEKGQSAICARSSTQFRVTRVFSRRSF